VKIENEGNVTEGKRGYQLGRGNLILNLTYKDGSSRTVFVNIHTIHIKTVLKRTIVISVKNLKKITKLPSPHL